MVYQQVLHLPEVDLFYRSQDGGTEPLLLLHGLADHSGVWGSLIDGLRGYHIVAPDLRGHGESSKPDRGYTCTDVIHDLNGLLQSLGWSSCHVVAHSWSAKVAVVWARSQPDRIRRLVLVDPFFINRLPGWMAITFPVLYRTLPFLKLMGPFSDYETAEQQAKQLKQFRGWSMLQQEVFKDAMEQMPDGRWRSKFVVQARNQVFQDVLEVAGLVEDVDIPTLFIQPEAGLNRTRWQLQPYLTHMKRLQIRQVPGNHWPFLTAPQAFNQAIADFLDVAS